ncbi:MAG: class I SAM-dependent methyltransferase [Anaerolineae bacterium]
MPNRHTCPNCGADGMDVFYRLSRVPAHSVLLFNSPQEAVSYPRGDIELAFCRTCGFIANVTFDPTLHRYSARYEATQGYSPTFNIFHRQLAADLVERHTLRRKTIIEIGCGQGDFLRLLCRLGNNRGLGFDPGYNPQESDPRRDENILFVQDYYSEEYAHHRADFICGRHVLEHIQRPREFVLRVRRSIGKGQTVVFFEVPNLLFTLRDMGIWDLIYEHCSYFSPPSLGRLFAGSGFRVERLEEAYQGQFLTIEAAPVDLALPAGAPEPALKTMVALAEAFAQKYRQTVAGWQTRLAKFARANRRVVVWGGGSKGVTFLNTLQTGQALQSVVDINPRKQGKYVAGTGQQFVPPEFLRRYRPDVIVIMNPVYAGEIEQRAAELGLAAQLVQV